MSESVSCRERESARRDSRDIIKLHLNGSNTIIVGAYWIRIV